MCSWGGTFAFATRAARGESAPISILWRARSLPSERFLETPLTLTPNLKLASATHISREREQGGAVCSMPYPSDVTCLSLFTIRHRSRYAWPELPSMSLNPESRTAVSLKGFLLLLDWESLSILCLYRFYTESYRVCTESTQSLYRIYTQSLYRVYTESIQSLYRVYTESTQSLQSLYRVYTESIQSLYRVYTESIQNLYRVYTESIQSLYRIYTESIQSVCRLYTESIHSLYRVYTESLQSLYRVYTEGFPDASCVGRGGALPTPLAFPLRTFLAPPPSPSRPRAAAGCFWLLLILCFFCSAARPRRHALEAHPGEEGKQSCISNPKPADQ